MAELDANIKFKHFRCEEIVWTRGFIGHFKTKFLQNTYVLKPWMNEWTAAGAKLLIYRCGVKTKKSSETEFYVAMFFKPNT